MKNGFMSFVTSPLVVSTFTAWFLAQFIKIFTNIFHNGKLDIRRFFGSGGMPSSHTSSVCCVTTMAGLTEGFGSAVFVVSLVFSLIVMYDASGVRLAAGKQAEVLNDLVEDFYKDHKVNSVKLKELLGHTPVEVLAGATLGIGIAVVFYYWIL